MSISDDDINESKTICNETEAEMDSLNDLDMEVTSCRINQEWQSIKSPCQSFLYGWGNTVDGELGLGGIEENHILEPREITFHDHENIKYGESYILVTLLHQTLRLNPTFGYVI